MPAGTKFNAAEVKSEPFHYRAQDVFQLLKLGWQVSPPPYSDFQGTKTKKGLLISPFMHQGPCARPLNQKAPENGAFCCKNSQKTNPTMFSADRHLACLEARKNTDSNNRRSIEDTARSGQGLTKKNGLGLPSRLLQIWCPGPDSNRHSFRYHPLKMACLPVSPPGQHSLLEVREIRLPGPGFATCAFFNSRRAGITCRGPGRFLNCRNTRLTCYFSALLGKDRQRKTCHKEDNRHQGGHPGQEAAAALTTENRLRGTATKCRTGIRALALLDQNQAHQRHGDHDVNYNYQCFQPIHTDSRKRFGLRTRQECPTDTDKLIGLQRCSANKTTIDIRL